MPTIATSEGIDMSGALDQFEALALNGRLRHGDHPLLTWCAANAVVTRDAAGNRKIDRSRATGRVDGLVAAVMAVAAMSGAPEERRPEYQLMIFWAFLVVACRRLGRARLSLYPLNVEDALGGAMATGKPRVGEPERAVDQAHGTRTEAVAVNRE
jgi:hypothetical protein